MGGWVAGFCETITNSAKLELGLGLSLAKRRLRKVSKGRTLEKLPSQIRY